MPAVGHNWTRAQIDALTSYTKQFAKTGGEPVAVNVEEVQPTAPTGAADGSRRG